MSIFTKPKVEQAGGEAVVDASESGETRTVAEPELWEWNSYRGYVFGEAGSGEDQWLAAVMKIRTVAQL